MQSTTNGGKALDRAFSFLLWGNQEEERKSVHFCSINAKGMLIFIVADIWNCYNMDMKKATNLISFLILMMVLVGCSKETVHIDFPFEVGDVENIEMYHYAGAPVSAEKKIVVAKTDITDLYHMFENLSLTDKQVEEITGADVTSFRFNLSDGTNYELVYVCNGVKNGKLKSSTGNFEYFTSSDIGSYWSNMDLESVSVKESELPKWHN